MSGSLLDGLVQELSGFLAPLKTAITDSAAMGHLLDAIGATAEGAGGAALSAALRSVLDVEQQIESLAADPSLGGIAQLLKVSGQAMTALRALSQASGPAAALSGFGEDLIDLLIAARLRSTYTLAFHMAALLGLIEEAAMLDERPAVIQNGTLLRASFQLDAFRFDRLPDLIRDPRAALTAEYGGLPATTADANALADKLFLRLQMVLALLGVPSRYGYPDSDNALLGIAADLVDHALILYTADATSGAEADAGVILTFSAADRGDLGLVVTPFGGLTTSWQSGNWTVEIALTADVQAFAYGRNGLTMQASASSVDVAGSLKATLPTPSDGPAVIFGAKQGTRIEIGGASLAATLALSDAATSLELDAAVSSAAIVIAPGDGDGDGFLQSVLPANGARCDFDLGIAWSNSSGLSVRGAAGLDVTLPASLSVGPVSIQSIHVGLHADGGGLSFECSATAGLSLGPVQIVVDRMGLLVGLTFPDAGGNLGIADGTIGFKSPSGLGVAIDAGIVTGGGFLSFDPTHSEYRGAAQLSIEGVGLSAFGLVQTQPEVSFLLLIGTTFPVPIELGFGFALAGVGGIVGINRSVALDALETAVWKGTAKNLLFPSAPITNAATILGTLDTLFPAAPGRYLFGPTGQITWGEPAIVTANVGLVIELPEPIRIALFGNVVAQFPLKNPIVVLQVTFAGGIDFGSERLFFDASLSGSRIERYPISGDMSLRSSLSSPKNLALAVGGFNPHFQPPSGFPTLSRLALDISDGPLHLHLAAYLAITTNTFQIGAAIDLKAHVCDCDLAGHFAFDALFVKNPFSFEIDIDASASIAFEGETFAGIHVSGSLAGPAPWHAKGSASISLLFFSVGVDFDHSWGSPPPPTLPPVDPWTTALAPALADPTSWKWVLPPGVQPVVTLALAAGGGPTLLDPAGEIILDQKAVPLNQSIDCFADTALATPLRFDLAALTVNGAGLDAADWITVTDEFAPAQFSTMTDDEKLSAESFVALVSGMAIGGTAASVGTSVNASLTYDQIILDSTRQQVGRRGSYVLPLAQQIASAASGPSARAPWRTSGLARFAAAPGIPSKAALAPAAFAIVSTATLGVAQPAVASTRYTAALALKDYVSQHNVAPQSVQAVQARAA